MSHIEIKQVQVADHYEVVNQMMQGLHINERQLNSHTAWWEDIATAYMRHIMRMQEECDGICLIAYVDTVAAALIFGYVEEDDDSRFEEPAGDTLYVSDGYVMPHYRRQGIYRMLNKALEDIFIAKGVKRILRITLTNNENMRKLLATEGYAATRILYEKWLQ